MAKLLLDFDSTLTQLAEHMLATYNARYGTAHTCDELTDWETLAKLKHSGYIWGADVWQSREWQLSVPPQPWALETVAAMRWAGLEPVIVTDRGIAAIRVMREWLASYGLAELMVIASSRDTLPKWRVAQEHGLSFAIEDAPHNAIDLAEKAGITVYLLDKPYNRHVSHERIERVADWYELSFAVEAEVQAL